jgi:hypothetical protein
LRATRWPGLSEVQRWYEAPQLRSLIEVVRGLQVNFTSLMSMLIINMSKMG